MTSEVEEAGQTAQFTVDEISPSYWRVTFENGQVYLVDPDAGEQGVQLVGRIEQSPTLTVVVFDSATPTTSWRTGI